jgi:(E)-4-hydroxy-3-methylbut-2-enyl-diphosphate synthase
VGLGILLHQGIGDTLRVSLSADPVLEVRAAYHILRSLGLRRRGVEIISCPLCGRSQARLLPVVRKIEAKVARWPEPLQIAVMGCPVNGPGEAKEADVGIAAGKKMALLFRKGKVLRQVKETEMVAALLEEAEALRQQT